MGKLLKRWILPVVLIVGVCWTGTLTLFNWWAAGGPPSGHPEVYEHRGNLFFIVTAVLLVSVLLLVARNVKSGKTERAKHKTE